MSQTERGAGRDRRVGLNAFAQRIWGEMNKTVPINAAAGISFVGTQLHPYTVGRVLPAGRGRPGCAAEHRHRPVPGSRRP